MDMLRKPTLGQRISAGLPNASRAEQRALRRGLHSMTSPTMGDTEGELPFADAMREFDASQSDGRCAEGLQPMHRGVSSLDRPMILLDGVVRLLVSTDFDVSPARIPAPRQP
jgi:hypothetical protein